MKDIVVCMFDTSGIMGEPWRAAGFRVIRLDILNTEGFRIPEPGESECVAYEITDSPKPAPVKHRPAKRKPCSTCGRNTVQAAAQQAVSVTVNIAKDQSAK